MHPMRIPKNFDGKLVTHMCGVLPCASQDEDDDFEGKGVPKQCLFVRDKLTFFLEHLIAYYQLDLDQGRLQIEEKIIVLLIFI